MDGQYKLSPSETMAAYKDFTLYTTAEPCPKCATAIRWAGIKECVYGTSIITLIEQGWGQADISSSEIFGRSSGLGTRTKLLGGVLANETDAYFAWQFTPERAYFKGCEREGSAGHCLPLQDEKHGEL